MNELPNKIGFALRTYWHSFAAIRRQYDPELIRSVQNRKLGQLIRYSAANVKYYRELFDHAGVEAEHIGTADDLCKIPITTKSELRERFWDFLPNRLPPCRISRTSGSTGVPVCLLSDGSSRMFNSSAVVRYRRALGLGFFGGAILTPLKREDEPDKKPHWSFLQGIHKTYYINPYVHTAKNREYCAKLFSRLNKPALIGITPAIRALAYGICDGLFAAVRPRVVITSGQCLEPHIKSLLESTFECIVGDIYACNEAGDIGWQCQFGEGYHINSDNVIAEILKDEMPVEPGQVGEIVITNLNRYSMPIIRYKNGDLGRFSRGICPCGRQLPMLAEIVGRTGEDIKLPDGKIVPWHQLKGVMNHPQIRQFQFIQNADMNLDIKYICEPDTRIRQLEHLLIQRCRSIVGFSISITTHRVDRIALSQSGKNKLVICNVR
jgi:phenylacetate-CoA ligase